MKYRYRSQEEMKDSGVESFGDIPIGWKVCKWGYITKVLTDYTANGSFGDLAKNVKYLDYKDYARLVRLVDLRSNLTNEGVYVNEKAYKYLSKSSLHGGEFLIANVGANSGLVCEMPKVDYPCTLAPNMMMAKFDARIIDSDFMVYSANSYGVQKQLLAKATQSSAQPKLNKDDFRTTQFVMPPIQEQQKIANFLEEKTSQFNTIISKKESLIGKLEEAKKSLISEVVTGKVKVVKTSDGYELVERKKEEMNDSGVEWLRDVPREWEIKKIKYSTQIYRGKFNHRPRNDPEYYDGQYPFIQTGDVANSKMYISKYTQTLNERGYSVSKEFTKGTLVMTIAANIGDIAILDFNACFPDSIVGFIPSKSVELKYMYYTYIIMKNEFMSTAIINTQMNLNVERIENLSIVVPTLEIQQTIVDYIEKKCKNIDDFREKTIKQIEKLNQAKQSLISEAVTGKIEILD